MLGQEPRRDHVIYFSQQLPQVGGAILFHSFTCEGTEALRDEPPAWGHTARGSQGPPGLCSLYCLYPNALLLGTPLLPDAIAQLWLAVGSRGGRGLFLCGSLCSTWISLSEDFVCAEIMGWEPAPRTLPRHPLPQGLCPSHGAPGQETVFTQNPWTFFQLVSMVPGSRKCIKFTERLN